MKKVFISLGYTSKSRIFSSCGKCMFDFIQNGHMFFEVAVSFCIPTSWVGGSRGSAPLPALALAFLALLVGM